MIIYRVLQELRILLARPYVSRELPGWGKVYDILVGGHRHNARWKGAPEKIVRDKNHGYRMHLDITQWGDRVAFFLKRWYDLEMQLFIKDVIQVGDTVVDIGANRGMFTLCASRIVGPSGRVISFEPNPVARKQLEREIESNGIENVEVEPYGASNKSASLELIVPYINSGEATFGKKDKYRDQSYTVIVPVIAADEKLLSSNPTLIKIDVEGFECKVIEGLLKTITNHYPIIITEIIEEHLVACGSSPTEVIKLLSGLGYTGHRLILEKEKGRHIWGVRPILVSDKNYDAVWVHKQSCEFQSQRQTVSVMT